MTDQRRAQKIAAWLDADHDGRRAGFGAYSRAFLREDGGPLQSLITRKLGDAHPDATEALGREQERIAAVTDHWNAARVAESTAALIEVAARHLGYYGAEKARHAVLDYGDQIAMSRSLLARAGIAPWVLYKLDGGLDHLLIDEAQDTSPTQWAVIAALAEEFFAGEGARAAPPPSCGRDEKRDLQLPGRYARAGWSPWASEPAGAAGRQSLPWPSPSLDAAVSPGRAVFARLAARDGVPPGTAIPPPGSSPGAGGGVELLQPLAPGDGNRWSRGATVA